MTTAEGITLEGIGFNALGGSVVLLCSFLFFGLAVRNRNTNIAPRCAARNPNVIFNPDSKLPSEDQVNGDNNVISSQLSKEEIQYKGSAYFGWIPWCLNLSYDAMIKGIPGTGTRNGGMGGHLLKVNLDAIILIRFHEMCLKITCLATVLCLFLILPLNITARCYYDMDLDECSVTAGNRKLTNFERTTAYNIQPIRDDKNRFVNASFSSGLGRLYAIVIVSWILVFYALKLISREWVENLSLRRVFYLESSHWENRNEELEETWLNQSCVLNESSQNLSHCSSKKCDQDYSKKNKRDAWIPHPEQRDTLPNIDIYSVLVGRLPSSPLEVDADLEASIVARENPDAWRLETAYSFFDKCVPPENGFSSSVAAITILPDAPKLALAWRKWYRHADLLRKYIFLEELLDEKRGYTIEDVNEEPSGVQGKSSSLNSTLAYYDDIYGHGKFPGVMDFGPEQTAIYSREYAQGAAACCPYGCGEERLRISKIDDIEIEIEETKELLKESEIDWMDAMHKAAMNEANKNKDLHIDLRDKTTFKNEEQENQFKDSQEGNNNNFRRRANTNMSNISEQSQQWEDHVHNVGEYNVLGFKEKSFKVFSGSWTLPSVKSIKEATEKKFSSMWKWATDKTKKVVKDIHQETTFAVVTFTSRRAAVMARRCLLDGKGLNRWAPIKDIPVPPLADAASCDLKTCRGCCRPVTLTIGRREQQIRKVLIYFVLLIMFIFYTFPITAVAALADPEKLYALWPQLQKLENNVLFKRFLSGFIPALLFTLFFALCPAIFKTIANSGSNARSVQEAENKALQYFWYFMLVTAFTGSSLGTMTLNAINEKKIENSTFTTVLLEIAGTLPTQVSSTWLNWIIFRTTITLPLHYMLQINSFLFECLGWKCCQRCVRGGGPGGQFPYRILVDSGIVLLCTFSLAPLCPLLSLAALIYFLYCLPLWRRNAIFIYRPKFDSGGSRWPFVADICVSSLLVGQILITAVMFLKKSYGPGIMATLPILPIIYHHRETRKRYLDSFLDTALFQTCKLDGLNGKTLSSGEDREEYLKFLIDAHKAAYIPICIACSGKDALKTMTKCQLRTERQEMKDEVNDESTESHFQNDEFVLHPDKAVSFDSPTSTQPSQTYIEISNENC